MVSDKTSVKRKSAAESAKPTKKIKKSSIPAESSNDSTKPTTSKNITRKKTSTNADTPARPSRKRAADFLNTTEETETVSVKPTSLSKPQKRAKKDSDVSKASKSTGASPNKSGENFISAAGSQDGQHGEGNSEDLTTALLAGFESSDEEANDDEEAVNASESEGLSLEQLPEIPIDAKAQKNGKTQPGKDENGPGVIYVGRIPHGFYEPQMRAYFSQFGKIKRLRLSRNKKTGRSKHYAFIEFASAEVADIVARTMNKYLMFGHILQVAVIPPAQVHEKLFLGANKRFRPVPRNKLQAKRLSDGADRDSWAKRISTEEHRREKKAQKMQEMGYDFEFPGVTQVSEVPKKNETVTQAPGEASPQDGTQLEADKTTQEAEAEASVGAIEDKPEVARFTEEVTSKEKTKKDQKSKEAKKMAVGVA